MAVPFYTPISDAPQLQLCLILVITWNCHFCFSHPSGCEELSHCGFHLGLVFGSRKSMIHSNSVENGSMTVCLQPDIGNISREQLIWNSKEHNLLILHSTPTLNITHDINLFQFPPYQPLFCFKSWRVRSILYCMLAQWLLGWDILPGRRTLPTQRWGTVGLSWSMACSLIDFCPKDLHQHCSHTGTEWGPGHNCRGSLCDIHKLTS